MGRSLPVCRSVAVVVGPVDWGAHPGETLERVMAVLVAQDHPDTIRRTPASGDGGIDLLVPMDSGYAVHQVKRFTGRIRSGEQRQIEDSWRTVMEAPRLNRPIIAYTLVVPTDPTPNEQHWFEQLTQDAAFPVSWRGQVHWDSLATKHPHVIDYFFGGGRERVAQRSISLQQAVVNPTEPLRPIDVSMQLASLVQALNRDDPHYRYDLQTSAAPPSVGSLPQCVMARTQSVSDGSYLTLLVSEKHRYALADEPIIGSMRIRIEDPSSAPELVAAIEEWHVFGTELTLPAGTVSGKVQAPGGLGAEFEAGGAWIGPSRLDTPLDTLRLVAVDADGAALTEVHMPVAEVTKGMAGGIALTLGPVGEVLSGSLRITPPDGDGKAGATLNLSVSDPTGLPVESVLPALGLCADLDDGTELQIRPQYGQATLLSAPAPEDQFGIPPAMLRHLRDLSVLQTFADAPILVPEEVDVAVARSIRELARMLSGEMVTGTWTGVTFTLNPDADRSDLVESHGGEFRLALTNSIAVTLGDQEVHLGEFTTVLRTARLADQQPADEQQAALVPGSDNTYWKRIGGFLAADEGEVDG
jgi:hypothetical protein